MIEPIIGLEIHIELKTKRKMFCQCLANFFGKAPNSQVCPVCLGLPGALPVPNKKAIEWTILIGKALNCQINQLTQFDRKHYFYPDLPKGYQISQYEKPIAVNGFLEIYYFGKDLNQRKRIKIRRVHLEEDTGKLIHQNNQTLIDFNRSGVPLVEIVTQPDFNDSDEVKRFLEELQVIIRYLGVSDADMEKGSMRLEPNISIKKEKKSNLPNYKVEIKNINSFRFVKQAIDYEIKRQLEILKTGKLPKQETRGFDPKKGVTYSQRIKEEAHDYRYFPEPDIPPIRIDENWQKKIFKDFTELPQEKFQRYINLLKLRKQEAFLLTRDLNLALFFDEIILRIKEKKDNRLFDKKNIEQYVANLLINKKITNYYSVDNFLKKIKEFLTPIEFDEEKINNQIEKIIKENPKAVDDYKKGKENAIMFLLGQVIKAFKGKVDPKKVREKIIEKINQKS